MNFGAKFKRLNLKYAYNLTSVMNEIVLSDVDENFYKYIWFYSKEPEDYYAELVNENIDKLAMPSKETILHVMITDVFYMTLNHDEYWFKDNFYNWELDEIITHLDEKFVQKLKYYSIKAPRFPRYIEKLFRDFENEKITYNEYEVAISNYLEELTNLLAKIETSMVEEVFFLLFNDKKFLFEFGKTLSNFTNQPLNGEYSRFKDGNGNFKRGSFNPDWLKKAIYFRDNGICQKCGKDLSGIISIVDERGIHLDHIIPLDKGGTNDPTNFQLLCTKCNLKKSTKILPPANYYQYYW